MSTPDARDDQGSTPPVWYGPSAPPQTLPVSGGYPPAPGATPPAPPPLGTGPSASPSPSPGAQRHQVGPVGLGVTALLAATLASAGTFFATQSLSDTTGTPVATRPTVTAAANATQLPALTGSTATWAAVATAVGPAVVSIGVTSSNGSGQGSGVIIDAAGHILTNNHVVASAGRGGTVDVTLNDGRQYEATITGLDPSTDLAVVTLSNPPSDLTVISVGSSAALTVGEAVMAVGNPLGLAGTVTTGIISALNRPVTTTGESTTGASEPVVTNAIQTSAAINPGNSGGALVDTQGRLIGINSSIASLEGSSGGQSGNIGIGFAIPVDEAMSIAKQLISSGTAAHAFLGVSSEDGTTSDGAATRAGARLTGITPGTPAAEAGLQTNDTIIAVDGETIDGQLALVAQIRERTVGDTVTLTIVRDGERREVSATLTTRPAQNG